MSIINAFLAGGGDGLEYEAGSFTPTSNVASRTVNFSKTHSKPPAVAFCFDASGTEPTTTRIGIWAVVDVYEIIRIGFNPAWNSSWTANLTGGFLTTYQAYPNGTYDGYSGGKRFTSTLPYGGADTSQTDYFSTRYYMNESRLNIIRNQYFSDSSGAVLEANHKYVWIAIWLPDSWVQPT